MDALCQALRHRASYIICPCCIGKARKSLPELASSPSPSLSASSVSTAASPSSPSSPSHVVDPSPSADSNLTQFTPAQKPDSLKGARTTECSENSTDPAPTQDAKTSAKALSDQNEVGEEGRIKFRSFRPHSTAFEKDCDANSRDTEGCDAGMDGRDILTQTRHTQASYTFPQSEWLRRALNEQWVDYLLVLFICLVHVCYSFN